MDLDLYDIHRLDEIYLDDIPYILHPDRAMELLLKVEFSNRPHCIMSYTAVYSSASLLADVEDGEAVFVKSLHCGKAFHGVYENEEENKLCSDLPLFLHSRLETVIEGQITRTFYCCSVTESGVTEFKAAPFVPRSAYADVSLAYAEVQAVALNAAHYVGGVTKSVGDTITGSVEALIDEPSMIADVTENIASTLVDGITYFPDVVLDAMDSELSFGSKERTNQRINNLVDGVSDTFEQVQDDYVKHSQAVTSGDFETAGSIIGEYAASIALPSKKIKVFSGVVDENRTVKVTDDGKVIILHGKHKGKAKTIMLSGKANAVETRDGITLKRDINGFPIFNSKFDTYVPDDLLGNRDPDSHFKYANGQFKKLLEVNKGVGETLGLTKEQIEHFLKEPPSSRPPSGLTWHHHQDSGRMQLVDRDEHRFVRHTGGMSIWGGGYQR